MNLETFLDKKEVLGDNWNKFVRLKKKFIEEGLSEPLATYKATSYLIPEKLEKIKLLGKNNGGLRVGLTFFFNSKEELELIGKYFKTNFTVNQIGDSTLLIELLKLLEETN